MVCHWPALGEGVASSPSGGGSSSLLSLLFSLQQADSVSDEKRQWLLRATLKLSLISSTSTFVCVCVISFVPLFSGK